MIRVVLFLVVVAVVALGVAWLADRPGEITVLWHGWRIETSVIVGVVGLIALTVLTVFLWSVLRAIIRSPDLLTMFLRNRRGAKGYTAISQGLIAIGTGDVRAARRFAQDARRFAPGEPLQLLLTAQTAQLSGDRAAAERAFTEMARRPDTKQLGLRGLFVEAQRRDDRAAAQAYAEEAVRSAPPPGWAGQAVLEFRSIAGDWSGALAALENNLRSGLLDRTTYKRQRAVLLTARALGSEDTDRDNAVAFALEAVKLAPTLLPGAALAGRLLADAGELRKAGRIIEKAWRANPHPDLAESFVHLRFGDSARDRLARAELLAQKLPHHPEGALAVARAALDAREFARARAALAPLLSQPTRRVALLMAEIEQVEHGDHGRAREWMARALHAARDPAWTADGLVSEKWLPVSPVSGRLDAFEWKVPLAELGAPEERAAKAVELSAIVDAPARAPEAEPAPTEEAKPPLQTEAAPTQPAVPEAPREAPRKRSRKPKAEAVIPLVTVPDDPGPDAASEEELAAEQTPEKWDKLRQRLS